MLNIQSKINFQFIFIFPILILFILYSGTLCSNFCKIRRKNVKSLLGNESKKVTLRNRIFPSILKYKYLRLNKKQQTDLRELKDNDNIIIKDDMFLKNASMTYFKLTDEESKVFKFLLDVNNHCNLNITFRASGEWIRDKILHFPTNKIEIVLDSIESVQFSRIIQEYIQNNPNLNISSVPPAQLSQFRRFETAVLNILDIQINFVNLKKPRHKNTKNDGKGIVSAFYKAHFKDFTINSLFYNINEDTIEDFTRKGISDMVEGIISTPHDPYDSLSKFPINAFKAIYFSTKYEFEIDSYLRNALRSREIKNIILNRVPQRRRSQELGLILGLPHSTRAIKLIYDIGYFSSIIPFPEIEYENSSWNKPLINQALHYNELFSMIINNVHIKHMKRPITEEEQVVLHYLSLVINLITNEGIEKIASRVKKALNSTNVSLLNLNRTASSILEKSYLLFNIFQRILHSLDGQLQNMTPTEIANCILDVMSTKFPNDYIKVITLIRKSKHYWPFTILFTSMHKFVGHDSSPSIAFEDALVASIKERNIDHVITMELILDGHDIQEILNIDCCPLVGTIIDSLYVWQLSNPNATRDDAVEYVLKNFKGSPTGHEF